MARVNYKKLVKQIPSKVQIAPRVYYDIVWQKEIVDTKGNHLYGLSDLTNKVITIKMDLPAKLTIEIYFHELYHCFSEELELGLTETQVLKMEHAAPYILKKGNVFND